MNREELLCRYGEVSRVLQLGQPVLVSGAAMVIHQLRPTCSDIDLAVSRRDFTRLAERYPVQPSVMHPRGRIHIPELELDVGPMKTPWHFNPFASPVQAGRLTMPVLYLSLRGLEAMKAEMVVLMNRQEDRRDLMLIRQAMAKDGRFR